MREVVVRDERPDDREAVRAVNRRAFGQRAEADLVEALHQADAAVVALVAEVAGELVGHILFSPVAVEVSDGKRLLGLAPMAVAPDFQRQGIGGQLVRAGLGRATAADYDGVVVLGHSEYYPRFGFAPAHLFALRSEYAAPPEMFMALALPGRSLEGVRGLVRYHPAFAAFSVLGWAWVDCQTPAPRMRGSHGAATWPVVAPREEHVMRRRATFWPPSPPQQTH